VKLARVLLLALAAALVFGVAVWGLVAGLERTDPPPSSGCCQIEPGFFEEPGY